MALRTEWVAILETVVGKRLAQIDAGILSGHGKLPVNLLKSLKTSPAGRSNFSVEISALLPNG
jgi:hypothetical protein